MTCIDGLENIKIFTEDSSQPLRDAISLIFQNLISGWSGLQKGILEQKMNLKQIQVQDPVLKWFYRKVFPKIWTYIEAEKETESLESIPMTDMIYGLLKDMGGISDDSVLSFEDWYKFIEAITSYSKKPPLTTLLFDDLPPKLNIKDKKVSLAIVMKSFKKYIDRLLKKDE